MKIQQCSQQNRRNGGMLGLVSVLGGKYGWYDNKRRVFGTEKGGVHSGKFLQIMNLVKRSRKKIEACD